MSHLQFFLISLLFQAGIYARHTKEQEKYRFHMFYTDTFFLILTFVSYNYHFEGHNCNLSEFGHKSSRRGIIKSSNIQIIKSESYLTNSHSFGP